VVHTFIRLKQMELMELVSNQPGRCFCFVDVNSLMKL
jgi:hypothetical protein